MITLQACHYATGERIQLSIKEGIIHRIAADSSPADIRAGYVAPAFVDIQINGAYGDNFSSEQLTVEGVQQVAERCWQHGIGIFYPTIITNSYAAIEHSLRTINRAIEQDSQLARALAGIHLEGPYLSAEDGPRGAHPREHIRPPDWEEFQRWQEAAHGKIQLVTLAPEHEGAISFIEKLVERGITVAIGHTAADGDTIRDAIAAGVRLSTHLGNGCHTMLPRHPNYLWEQLAADELWASIIADGQHLPASVVKCIVRMKTLERVIVTCDASSLAGLPPGQYQEWGQQMEILPAGKIVVAGQGVLAGSWSFTDHCVSNVMKFADLSLAEAIALVTEQPRRLMDLPHQSIELGMPADLVLFDWDEGQPLSIRAMLLAGEVVYSNPVADS